MIWGLFSAPGFEKTKSINKGKREKPTHFRVKDLGHMEAEPGLDDAILGAVLRTREFKKKYDQELDIFRDVISNYVNKYYIMIGKSPKGYSEKTADLIQDYLNQESDEMSPYLLQLREEFENLEFIFRARLVELEKETNQSLQFHISEQRVEEISQELNKLERYLNILKYKPGYLSFDWFVMLLKRRKELGP